MRNEEMFFFFKPPRTNQRREPPYLPVNWMARWPLEEVHRCPATNLIFFPVFFWCGGGGRPPSPPSEDDMIYLFPSPGCVPPHFSRVSASAKLEEIGDWSIECVCVCVCVWVCLGCVTVCVCVCVLGLRRLPVGFWDGSSTGVVREEQKKREKIRIKKLSNDEMNGIMNKKLNRTNNKKKKEFRDLPRGGRTK